MNVSVSFLNGFGEGLPKAAAYDPALTLAVTGLGTLTGAQALVHTLDGETALSDAAAVVSGSAEVSLNTPAVQAIFEEGRTTPYAAALTVRDATTGEIHGVANLLIYPAAPPDLPGDDPTLVEALYVLRDGTRAFTGPVSGVTPAADAHLATKKYVDDGLDAVTAGSFNVASLEARVAAITDATLFAAQETDESVPTKATGTQVAAWLGTKYEPAQSAASQAEAEAGTETAVRSWSPIRVWQAVTGKLLSILTAAGTVLYRSSSGLAALTLRTAVRTTGTADDTSLPTEAAVRTLHGTHKLDATVAPDEDDDSTVGYHVGSQWFDVTADTAYVCMDPAEGAAVWKEITGDGAAGIGGSTGSVDNAILRADGTDGDALQASNVAIADYEAATQANVGLAAIHDTEANVALRLQPKGTGPLILGPAPDGTATGGNARGAKAVDLQVTRSAATHVASGSQSMLHPGNMSTASGDRSEAGGHYSVASATLTRSVGYQCSATATYAIAEQFQCTAAFTSSKAGGSGGITRANGHWTRGIATNRQAGLLQMYRTIASTSATNLFCDGASQRAIPGPDCTWHALILITARQADGSSGRAIRQVSIRRDGYTTTTLEGPVTVIGSDYWHANLGTPTIAITADDTNEALDLQITQANTTSTDWHAALWLSEVRRY